MDDEVRFGFTRHESPVRGPQGLAWDGAHLWVTSAADGRVYAIDARTLRIDREFVPPFEALGITWTGSEFRLILAPGIDEPDLERDRRYVYAFSPGSGFTQCFECPDGSGSYLAYADGVLYCSQAWDKRLIALGERGAAARVVHLERRPVGMTIIDDVAYLVTVDDAWGDARFERIGIRADDALPRVICELPFKPRGIAFDGARFWSADRDHDTLVSFALG